MVSRGHLFLTQSFLSLTDQDGEVKSIMIKPIIDHLFLVIIAAQSSEGGQPLSRILCGCGGNSTWR
jgi:hypothetical protein